MSLSTALQKAVIDALQAHSELAALTDGEISENAVSSFDYPYVTLGPSSFVPDDADCISGRIETVQVDCWSRIGGSLTEARKMLDMAYAALHEVTLVLPDPYAAVDGEAVLARAFSEPDRKTAHGVLQVSFSLEDQGA